jgi:predicted NBD/HSP70 family sugar kinase
VLRSQVSTALGRSVSSQELITLAGGSDSRVRDLLSEGGRQLGLALANLVTLLNPERVIVSGEGARLGPAFFEPMTQAVRETAFAGIGASVDIVIQRWGDDAWAIGAATLVLRELFSLPVAGEQPRLALVSGA